MDAEAVIVMSKRNYQVYMERLRVKRDVRVRKRGIDGFIASEGRSGAPVPFGNEFLRIRNNRLIFSRDTPILPNGGL